MHTHTDTTIHTPPPHPHRHRRWSCRLDTDPAAVLTARTLTATALTGWDTDLTDDAVLVTSELVTNALTHGTPPVTVDARGAPVRGRARGCRS